MKLRNALAPFVATAVLGSAMYAAPAHAAEVNVNGEVCTFSYSPAEVAMSKKVVKDLAAKVVAQAKVEYPLVAPQIDAAAKNYSDVTLGVMILSFAQLYPETSIEFVGSLGAALNPEGIATDVELLNSATRSMARSELHAEGSLFTKEQYLDFFIEFYGGASLAGLLPKEKRIIRTAAKEALAPVVSLKYDLLKSCAEGNSQNHSAPQTESGSSGGGIFAIIAAILAIAGAAVAFIPGLLPR